VESITFTGGEVLLLPYFWEIVEIARNHNVQVNFLTDGIRFDKQNLEQALALGVSGVSVSLDSLDSVVNEFQRVPKSKNISNTTENIIQNIIYASEYINSGLSITINQTITKYNINSIRPMVKFAKKHRIRHLVHLAGLPAVSKLNSFRIEKCTYKELYFLAKEMKLWAIGHKGLEDYTEIAFSFLGKSIAFTITCPMMKTAINVRANGDISPCFYRTDLCLGNIFTSDMSMVLNRKRPDEIKNGICATLGCACMLEREN
jgi:MoaA/NifB/PqqE/SkfB family radical SAM enzyme